jgi:hypothetical protein
LGAPSHSRGLRARVRVCACACVCVCARARPACVRVCGSAWIVNGGDTMAASWRTAHKQRPQSDPPTTVRRECSATMQATYTRGSHHHQGAYSHQVVHHHHCLPPHRVGITTYQNQTNYAQRHTWRTNLHQLIASPSLDLQCKRQQQQTTATTTPAGCGCDAPQLSRHSCHNPQHTLAAHSAASLPASRKRGVRSLQCSGLRQPQLANVLVCTRSRTRGRPATAACKPGTALPGSSAVCHHTRCGRLSSR